MFLTLYQFEFGHFVYFKFSFTSGRNAQVRFTPDMLLTEFVDISQNKDSHFNASPVSKRL